MNTSRRGKFYASLATLGAAALVLTSCGGGPGAPETTAAGSESGAAEGKAEVTVYGTIADTEAELLAQMNASNGALVASLDCDDEVLARRLARELQAFKVRAAATETRAAAAPFTVLVVITFSVLHRKAFG